LRSEEKQICKLLQSFKDDGNTVCPTCGTSVDQFHEHLEEQRERLVEWVQPRLKELERLLTRFDDYHLAKQAYKDELTAWQNAVASEQEAVQEFGEVLVPTPIDGKMLQEAVRLYDSAKRALDWQQQQHTENYGNFERFKAEHKSAKRQLEECKTAVAALQEQVSEDSVRRSNKMLAAHKEAVVNYNRACASAENLEEFIHDREEELKRVQVQLKRSRKARRWLQDLKDVRNEVMHRDKLPAMVHRHALQNMEDEINANLEKFNSPYFVTTDESLGFLAKFPNGTVMPANGLSGGQKVMLAMAFRLAINSLFASQVGMMILDEPTDGLDTDNRRLAADVFRTLGQLARDRGQQVIVITHDDSLMPVFDQKLVLQSCQ
jgi:DNA repair exonuclease SbcCD ATPase subunit